MLIINFSHSLTAANCAEFEALSGQQIERVINVSNQIDVSLPIMPQVEAMIEAAGLSATEWQELPVIINPPSLNYSTAAMLAVLHGRMGYFPAIVRIRPKADRVPPVFEVTEVINLQGAREVARIKRT